MRRTGDTSFVLRLPRPALAGHVLAYGGYSRTWTEPTTCRMTALGSVTLIIDIDTSVTRAIDGTPAASVPSPVRGLSDQPTSYEQTGRETAVIVELSPHGAKALFGLPLKEIANTDVSLHELLGPRARRLSEQLAEAGTWSERLRILDERLTTWISDGPALATPLQGAWRQLITSAGRARIDAVADQIGWSRQHLNARFREQVGLPAKTIARIARLHKAIDLATRPNPPLWSHIAAACGYTDQSHLNRDFRALTGHNPTELITSVSQGSTYLGAWVGTRLVAPSSAPILR
ncbi:helix-turn-helix transcriptional regulator [Saccharothrix carnea]|nr:helix-turn-helix transcriptional regulator [Saccharothrix carnea]